MGYLEVWPAGVHGFAALGCGWVDGAGDLPGEGEGGYGAAAAGGDLVGGEVGGRAGVVDADGVLHGCGSLCSYGWLAVLVG